VGEDAEAVVEHRATERSPSDAAARRHAAQKTRRPRSSKRERRDRDRVTGMRTQLASLSIESPLFPYHPPPPSQLSTPFEISHASFV
jgi:hypothetical protein